MGERRGRIIGLLINDIVFDIDGKIYNVKGYPYTFNITNNLGLLNYLNNIFENSNKGIKIDIICKCEIYIVGKYRSIIGEEEANKIRYFESLLNN